MSTLTQPPRRAALMAVLLRVPPATATRRGIAQRVGAGRVSVRWWQYREEGTYPGTVPVTARGVVTVK
ncbi:hypothetical protein Ade02nite_34440 [Paractinoplanes deccanensis]|uniref:Uncharacterized protein n=1 Tax=Paractinoplanes deccanensis TaxID=113561 RepID=A0ABQ3Y480_9ACTN|nr:hypothetical protein Ade02nite_34440 [Actinoplanes deccanensis]